MTSGGTIASPAVKRPDGAAGRYATALYELADERQQIDMVVEQADGLARLIDTSPELQSFLRNPMLDIAQDRTAMLAVMAAQGFSETLQHFVGVIVNNRRLSDLRSILTAFALLVADRRGIVAAEVASAHPLTDLQRVNLRARLTEAGYGRVDIQERVDASLLGGLVVRIGSRLYDASLRSRLSRLHYSMKGAA